jgi:hypothetical protein
LARLGNPNRRSLGTLPRLGETDIPLRVINWAKLGNPKYTARHDPQVD